MHKMGCIADAQLQWRSNASAHLNRTEVLDTNVKCLVQKLFRTGTKKRMRPSGWGRMLHEVWGDAPLPSAVLISKLPLAIFG